jgi:transketolase C-terminal domain/subunit
MPYKQDPSYKIYEYACHEGNYMMIDALTGARALEKEGVQVKVDNNNFVRPVEAKK